MRHYFYVALCVVCLAGCSAAQRTSLAAELPGSVAAIATGAAETATGNPLGIGHIVGGIAILLVAGFGGPKLLAKIKTIFGPKS